MLGTTVVNSKDEIDLCETLIDKNHEWLNNKISEINCGNGFLIALIKKGEEYFVPNGETKIILNDMLIFYAT